MCCGLQCHQYADNISSLPLLLTLRGQLFVDAPFKMSNTLTCYFPLIQHKFYVKRTKRHPFSQVQVVTVWPPFALMCDWRDVHSLHLSLFSKASSKR